MLCSFEPLGRSADFSLELAPIELAPLGLFLLLPPAPPLAWLRCLQLTDKPRPRSKWWASGRLLAPWSLLAYAAAAQIGRRRRSWTVAASRNWFAAWPPLAWRATCLLARRQKKRKKWSQMRRRRRRHSGVGPRSVAGSCCAAGSAAIVAIQFGSQAARPAAWSRLLAPVGARAVPDARTNPRRAPRWPARSCARTRALARTWTARRPAA